ncbi:hypothetical protein PTI98_005721 [Pleurotus ostreatus]|nr:hypothetical protein PTI98_005721 [Pleurotus ostreatus]
MITTSTTSVPPTPRATRVSPRKREPALDAPAVQMRFGPHSQPMPPVDLVFSVLLLTCRVLLGDFSFGTVDNVEDGLDMPPATQSMDAPASPELSSPQKASTCVRKPAQRGTAPRTSQRAGAKRRHESETPSPPRLSTAKASADIPGAEEAKTCRPHLAKRIRPIARLDSDDDDAIVVSLDESASSDEEVDQLMPDTPRPPLIPQSSMLPTLDIKAEESLDEYEGETEDEAIAAAWGNPSPPPAYVNASPLKARGKAKASLKSKVIAEPVKELDGVVFVMDSDEEDIPAQIPLPVKGKGKGKPIALPSRVPEAAPSSPSKGKARAQASTSSGAKAKSPVKLEPSVAAKLSFQAIEVESCANDNTPASMKPKPSTDAPGNGLVPPVATEEGAIFDPKKRQAQLLNDLVFSSIPPPVGHSRPPSFYWHRGEASIQ